MSIATGEAFIKNAIQALQLVEEIIILLSTKGIILFMNQVGLSLYSWEYENVVGKSFSNLLKNDGLASPLPKEFSFTSSNIYLENIKTNLNAKNHKTISWKLVSYHLKEKNDSFLLVGKDITEIKKLKEKIFELDSIIAQTPGNLYWYSKDLVYLGCNENSAKSLNMKREETIGKDFKALMKRVKTTDESLVDTFVDQGKEVIRTGKALLDIEEPPFCGPDRKLRHYLANKVPLYNKEGEIYGVIGISTDITYLKELEKNLREEQEKALVASQSKSEFIANISHDIRTPIAGILGVVQNMLNTVEYMQPFLSEEPEKIALSHVIDLSNKLIKTVQQDGELLIGTTEELLHFFNEVLEIVCLESGKVEVQAESFDFREIVQHNLDLLQPMAQHKKLKLINQMDPKIPTYLEGLRRYLDRILLNLLSNALKFTDIGWVKVSAKLFEKSIELKKGDKIHVRISIEDTGIGIPNDKIETIFENFTRLTPAYEGLYKGAGLGLYTVKQYVEAMNGTIKVRSKVGKGSCFILKIPLTVSDHTTQIKTSVRLSKPLKTTSLETRTISHPVITKPPTEPVITSILLVEDSKMAAMAANFILRKILDCVVDIAENGKEALAKAQNNLYDLVVMDVGLPDLSGVEVTKRIRALADKAKSQVPIVALTGHANDGKKRQECLEAGMQEVLSKPLQPLALELVLQQLAFKASANQEL